MRKCISFILLIILLHFTGNAQWVRQNSGTPAALKDVIMLDSLTAIAVGNWGTIIKTTNAGTTWLPKPGGGYNWNTVAFANPFRGIVVGEGHNARITTDGGETWTIVYPGGGGELVSAAFMGDVTIFTGTSTGSIIRSTNQGATWAQFSLGQHSYSMFFVRGSFVSFTGYILNARTMFKTENSGSTWSPQPLPITNAGSAFGAARSPGGTIFVAGADGSTDFFPIILRQTLSDSNWQLSSFGSSFPGIYLTDVAAPGPAAAYACGSAGMTFKTTDDGISWAAIPTTTLHDLQAIHFYNERRGFAVGNMGTILFTSNAGVITDVQPEGNVPTHPELLQNYPNPFNPTTTIEFRLTGGEFVELSVYDISGRKIQTLVHEKLSPGTFQRAFDGSNVASGVYFYRLNSTSIESGRRSTKNGKMLLLR